jgi:hypothetical protein
LLNSHELEDPRFDDSRLEEMLARTKARSRKLGERRHRRQLVTGAATALALVLIGISVFGTGAVQRIHRNTPPVAAADVLGKWDLVSDLSSLWQIQLVDSQSFFLTCPFEGVCYLEGRVGNTEVLEITRDGGTEWERSNVPAVLDPPFGCLDKTSCAALGLTAGRAVFTQTQDGGRSWTSLPFPAQVAPVSCATSSSCVAITYEGDLDTAMVTSDAGRTWSRFKLPQSLLALGTFAEADLQCFSDGTCIALGSVISKSSFRISGAALYSTNGGRTWSMGHSPRGFDPGYNFSCNDVSHCMALGTDGSRNMVAVSSDGGRIWLQVPAPPDTSRGGVLNWISCPTGTLGCWVSGLDVPGSRTGRAHVFVAESTSHGRSWRFSHLPSDVDGFGNISCPTASTCYGLGSLGQRSGKSSLVFLSMRG